MCTAHRLLIALLIPGGLLSIPGSAHAAQSHDSCAGFIDSLPATISTQGVWCLRKDLSTGITAGKAIQIQTNNVTIDCNDFKIGGLAAGTSSTTTGIYAHQRQNVSVRRCGIRGFLNGIEIYGGAGHLVEDNRLDNNLFWGIRIDSAENSVVRRNRIYDTGGYILRGTSTFLAFGIRASADVIDNTVAKVFASDPVDARPRGIEIYGDGHEVRGNQVREIMGVGSWPSFGILNQGLHNTIEGNRISNSALVQGAGIHTVYAANNATFCSNNISIGYSVAYYGCDYSYGNL